MINVLEVPRFVISNAFQPNRMDVNTGKSTHLHTSQSSTLTHNMVTLLEGVVSES